MSGRNWGAIRSGATFEALVSSIVSFEEKGAKLFGRPGKDGGQDAKSRDGTRVFQAKFHENESAAAAMRDAKKEAAKIQTHLKTGAPRFNQWKGVTHWCLVTNATFNPTDDETWEREVVPLYRNLGLIAELWKKADLDFMIDRHREIHRSFFESETRAFYTISEIRERLPLQEPFLNRQKLGDFCGRQKELSDIRDFLASRKLFLVVHGAGGVGKTRLLYEAGEDATEQGNWQVLWANIVSMTSSASWFGSVNPEQPTLLLVDEPLDEEILRLLSEQLGGRLTQWKIVVAVRSPKDPVLRFLFSSRMKINVEELPISFLPDNDAEQMCYKLLLDGPLAKLPEEQLIATARALSKRFDRIPIWLTLAVQILEEKGEIAKIPESANELANEYLSEVETSQNESSSKSIRELLRWIALLGTVNQQDEGTIKLLGDVSHTGGLSDVRRSLASLISRRAVIQRGAVGRYVELKPDVLRDHVLLNWLSIPSGLKSPAVVASDEAKVIVEAITRQVIEGQMSGHIRSILISIARTELLLKLNGHDLRLLESFFARVQKALPSMNTSFRIALADLLEAVAQYQPEDTSTTISVMRRSIAQDTTIDGLFRPRTVGHKDVILTLAWPLFHAAMGAQTTEVQETVLRELCSLVRAEAEIAPELKGGLPNDGKRAAALLERVLEGGPEFWAEFDTVTGKLGLELLDLLEKHAPDPGTEHVIIALIHPAIALERRQTWSEGYKVHFQTFAIGTGHPGWDVRASLLARIQELLESQSTPFESRILLWRAFVDAHRNVNQLYRQIRRRVRYIECIPTVSLSFLRYSFPGGNWKIDPSPIEGVPYHEVLLRNLAWANDLLNNRLTNLEELSTARSLWDWHHRFESDKRLKAVADRLEAIYAANDLAAEFEPLLAHDDYKQRDIRADAKAEELSASSMPEQIDDFINRALAFLGEGTKFNQILGVALELGMRANEREVVRVFVEKCLKMTEISAKSDFGAVVATSWVDHTRKGDHPESVHTLAARLTGCCGSDEQRANLLNRIYGRISTVSALGKFTSEEHSFLRSQSRSLAAAGYAPTFVRILAFTITYEWLELSILLEEIVQSTPPADLRRVLDALIDSVYWVVRESNSSDLPVDLNLWLLDQLILIPDIEAIGGQMEWHLEEIFGRIDLLPVNWLPQALSTRIQMEQKLKEGSETRFRAVGSNVRISKYVRKVEIGDVTNEAISKSISELLNFASDKGTVGYRLQEILRDVDPDGIMVPNQVANRISVAADEDQLWSLARIGGTYGVGSNQWRLIAKSAIIAGRAMGLDMHTSIFPAFESEKIRTWTGSPGEVPSIFMAKVDGAKAALAAETDVDLQSYWQWRLTAAEAEYNHQAEFAKEERGE